MDYNKSSGLRNAFTLTEVLLAIGIVGVIAALVLPTTVSKFHSELLAKQYERQERAIKSALDTLVVTENKANFGETMMYSGSAETDVDETAGKFIKKYLKVANYYGSAANNADKIKSDGFGASYFEYGNNANNKYDKKPYDISSDLIGACAKLKNGATICLEPQVGQNSIQGVIDLNGSKGPNIVGRDYMKFSIDPVQFTTFDSLAKATVDVSTQANPNLTPDPENPCEIGDWSTPCCTYYMNKGVINSKDHDCCNNSEIRPLVPACASDIQLRLNLYPSSCNLKDSTCKMYIQATSTTAKQNGLGILTLPVTPPDVRLYCDGKPAGSMSGAVIKQAVESTDQVIYFTMNRSYDATCGYQSGKGIMPTKSSVVFTNDGIYQNYSYNGVNWSIEYF